MSPSNNDPNRAHRKRLRRAILTANGAGAVSGAITQAICSDPTIALLVGTFVSGTVADGLLQVAVAHDERDTDVDGEAELADDHGAPGREAEGEVRDDGRLDLELDGRNADGRDGDAHELRTRDAAHGHRRHRGTAGHGYARCAEGEEHQPGARQPYTPARRQPETAPQNPRHRHLHRGGQRFVRRLQKRAGGQQADKPRDAS
ncbi:hypothetical protein J2X68_006804 [Streptomyces sp. 3330]|uniref:hypothetical protein n=1 Tax=Streptomyces sp. 3330 TaxID=2817755 RepID=UPI00285906C5|nr:hypothetical protein [Streptomyces sp. 3330]MDR6980066.1 hypothetical protein [Streptomyces sp. 3330]